MALMLGALLTLMLAACNEAPKSVDTETNEEKKVETKAKDEANELTLQEVFDKATEAHNELTSFESNLKMEQTVEMNDESFDTNSDIVVKMIIDPLTMHQKMSMEVPGGEAIEMDTYLTKDGLYMFEPLEQQWMQFPEEFSDQVIQLSGEQSTPTDQLKQFESFTDDFQFEEDGANYKLTLKASGKKFDEFLKESVKNTLPEDMQLDENIFEDMTFDHVEYVILIDKETFYLNALDIVMDSQVTVEGETMKLHQKIESTYSNINEIDEIKIPKEALENAQEVDLEN